MSDDSLEMLARDFTPTKEQISLHGLGFIQVKLPNRRMHVWHPDLPRRDCYAHSAIHNHRFSFRSQVLVGRQVNRRYNVLGTVFEPFATHDRISHDGPRSPKGGRQSYFAELVRVCPLPDEIFEPGQSYEMPALQYHETPNSGVVVTIMEKLTEGRVHASSLIERGHQFHQDFDRHQLSEARLWEFVTDALKCELTD